MGEAKYCGRCKHYVPIGEFCRNVARSDGLSGYCAPCQRASEKASMQRLRARALAVLGGVCARCGYSAARALQIDHVNGGGSAARRERAPGTAGRAFLRDVIAKADAGIYQVLCANCNWIKKHEEGEHVGSRVYVRSPPTERTLRGRTPESEARRLAASRAGIARRTPEQEALRRQRISATKRRRHAERGEERAG